MTTQKWSYRIRAYKRPDGFILLEVLLAMSLIMGSWLVTIQVYQNLVLSLNEQESKRSQFRKAIDAHEIAIYSSAVIPVEVGGVKNDATRVPSRNHAMRSSTQSLNKDKRSFDGKTN